jgi:hypothetical protein
MSRHWTFLGDAPTSWTFDSSIVAWTDSRAIITGGSQMGKIQAIQDSIFVYNKETTDIETLPSMIQARTCHAAVIVGGSLFVIGGQGPNRIRLNSIEVLDLNNPHEWTLLPVSMEIARSHCSAVAVNEHEIYIIGGVGGGRILDSVEILNTASPITISQGPPMMMPRCSFATSLVGDSIVVTGGAGRTPATSEEMVALQSCELLALGSGEERPRWQPLQSNVVTKRFGHKGLAYGSCMVVVGGVDSFGSGDDQESPRSCITMSEVWNRATGTWTQLSARLLIEGDIHGFVKMGNDLVCFVGQKDPKVYCLFSPSGLLEHQRRQIRFNELIADERVEIVIPLLLEGLWKRGWLSLFYECIRETNGRLIPQR